AVAAAYGWSDLDLGHGFHQTKQGLRYTISEAARREVLGRLLRLNHERYAEEVAKGLHEKKKPKATRTRAKKAPSASAPSLFGGEEGGCFMSATVLPAVPSPTQLRAMLEEMVLGALLGPAGGPDEELTEGNVHDRYLVGVLAPRPLAQPAP